jgi:hypothetical protein
LKQPVRPLRPKQAGAQLFTGVLLNDMLAPGNLLLV